MKLDLAAIKETLSPYWDEKLETSIEQINFAHAFPEALNKETTSYEELRSELLASYETIIELIFQLETVTTYINLIENEIF